MIFTGKEKVTPQKLASDIWGAFTQVMQHIFEDAKKFDRESFFREHGWDYDKKRFADETVFLFTFLIYNEVEIHFPQKKIEILREFTKIVREKDMDFLLDPLKDYSVAWYDALARELEIDDDSSLNNPIYCIARLASTRCFGKKELDVYRIMMFSSRITAFVEFLSEEFKRHKVV